MLTAPASDKISFLNHYFGAAPDNAVNEAMIKYLEAHDASRRPVLARRLRRRADDRAGGEEGGGTDVDKMIAALEGWTFDGPKGEMTVRAEDHAMLQPMFQARWSPPATTSRPS